MRCVRNGAFVKIRKETDSFIADAVHMHRGDCVLLVSDAADDP
jgi:hypothetical protein